MNKLKIAFDQNSSKYQDFNELIQHINSDLSESVDLYFISQESVEKNIVDIDESKIFVISDYEQIKDKITEKKINIYLTNDKDLVNYLQEEILLRIDGSRVTGCETIHVNNLMNAYKVKRRYVEFLDFWVAQINKAINGK